MILNYGALSHVEQYTVTMFLIDVSSSMANTREIEVEKPNGETEIIEMTNLEWTLQFVKLKVQELVCSRSRQIIYVYETLWKIIGKFKHNSNVHYDW